MDWWTHILAFIGGLGAGWTAKVLISYRAKQTHRNTFTSQKNNHAGGDIVAGDMRKTHHE